METIISYIDNLFRNYPDSPQARKAREELLGIMEDKYNELKEEGMSEHEAIGVVISEFGSMDEIALELGAESEESHIYSKTADGRAEKKVTLEQAKNYIALREDFGIKIGIGVALCILSPVVSCVTEAFAAAGFLSDSVSSVLGSTALFIMVAIAVGLFITSRISISKYDDYEKSRILLDYETKTFMTEQHEKYNKVFGTKIAIGVVLCVLSVVPESISEELFVGTSFEWIAEMMSASLFGFVAVGVFLFIEAGIKQGAYEVLLGKRGICSEK